jgi:hypothetical protein
VLSSAIPAEVSGLLSQSTVNCFAWQEFIALNWVADASTCVADPAVPPSAFGNPNDTRPVVWETYKEASEVFQPKAAAPSSWCAQQPMASALRARLAAPPVKTSLHGYKVLGLLSKDAGNPSLKLSEYAQAATGGSWLTSQDQIMTLYEIRMNQDEFNYLNVNKLYDAKVQQTFVQNPGINLPDGTANFSSYGKIGSIEFKAAWIELPDSSQWPFYKTSKAYVLYPGANEPKLVTVGLVGLHIIHKTGKSPQFIWATFEHVNNAASTSDIGSGSLLPWYKYYDNKCNPQTDHYHCYANAQPPSATPQNPYFPHAPNDAYNAPVQVVRENPISTTPDQVVALNQWVWDLIRNQNAKSVFLNYQLVDVLWANMGSPVPPASQVPLTKGDPRPNSYEVANTTMESYFQNSLTCLDCHASAPIASVLSSRALGSGKPVDILQKVLRQKRGPAVRGNRSPQYASDYSFLFSRAQPSRGAGSN